MFYRYFSALPSAALIFALVACNGRDAKPLPTNQAQVDKLEMEIKELRSQSEAQQQRITSISNMRNVDNFYRDRYQSATFDPAANEIYARVDTSIGPFLITVHDVKPNADGVKVILNIGDITAARASGGKLHIKWGVREPDVKLENYSAAYDAWASNIKERDIEFTETLVPGRWNKVAVVLPGVSANSFGYLNVSMEVSQLQLLQQP